MKKIVTKFLVFAILAVVGLMPSTVFGSDPVEGTVAAASSGVIAACPAGTFRVRRHTRTKKKLLNAAVAGGIGAALGGGLGGKRGALIGVGSGAGGYLTYRYIRDRRGRCVRSYRRG
jgi:hypothetical protein